MRQKLPTTLFQVYKKLSILMTNPVRTAVPIYDKSWLNKCTSELHKTGLLQALKFTVQILSMVVKPVEVQR